MHSLVMNYRSINKLIKFKNMKTIELNKQELLIVQTSLNQIFDSCDKTTQSVILNIINKLEE